MRFGSYGKSVLNKELYFIRLGRGPKEVFYSASMHANEWINSVFMMKFIENYAEAYRTNGRIYNQSIRELFNRVSIYVSPMVNPDGVDLVLDVLNKNSTAYKNARTIASNYPNIPFPNAWKANILGIDINLQFPSNWALARENKFAQGFIRPAPRDFVGYGPLTEPESLGIYNFTLSHEFRLILAYHTQGEVIFWRYLNLEPAESENIAKLFQKASGYELDDRVNTNSYAGYRDWFIDYYGLPGFTIETGKGVNPLPISQFDKIYKDNIGILIIGAQQV